MKNLISLLRESISRHRSTPPVIAGDYARRLKAETTNFADQVDVHDLPAIFHYWSNKYLRPMQEAFGFSNPDQFFVKHLSDLAHRGAAAKFVSIGAGNCDTEVRIAAALKQQGFDNFVIDCIDINADMLERGKEMAATAGVATQVQPMRGDFNEWRPRHRYQAVIANQSLHHVVELEHLFEAVHDALDTNGLFLVSDIVGRNGHQRWPEALAIVQEFWRELPNSYRYNIPLKRHEEAFMNWDCSGESFEGIRAQDVLPLLCEHFNFELFIGFANVVDPFIDRAFGHHFNADAEWDRDFIDRVHARDEAEILAGRIKPTHMIAVLRNETVATPQIWRHLTPEFCIRTPD